MRGSRAKQIAIIFILTTMTIEMGAIHIEKIIWRERDIFMVAKEARKIPTILLESPIGYREKKEEKLGMGKEPSSWYMLIDEPGYYELTQDIVDCTKECGIYITASNVVLDGKGHILSGVGNESSKYGIYLKDVENVIIRNITIRDWYYSGIYLQHSNRNTIYDNRVEYSGDAIYLNCSSNNNISFNIIGYSFPAGIFLEDSDNNIISCNMISDACWYGIGMWLSSKNTIVNNTIQSNYHDGIRFYNSNNNVIIGNIISNNGDYGMYLSYSRDNTIAYNTIQNNKWGMYLQYYSDCNTIPNNTFIEDGIFLQDSFDNEVENNTVNGKPLIYMENAEDMEIRRYAGQIILIRCRNITIEKQNITNVEVAIELYQTNETTIKNNTIKDNKYGVYLIKSYNNSIYMNYFIDNKEHYHKRGGEGNRFYSPQQMTYVYRGILYKNYIGNYWSDYNGTDINMDGIGDQPYGPDEYPLIGFLGEDIILVTIHPPSIKIIKPENGETLNKTTIMILWNSTDPNNDIEHYEVYIDGFPINTSIPLNQNNYTLILTEGTHIITIGAIDRAGNIVEDSIGITIDTTPPKVKILSPDDKSILNMTTITIEVSGSDNINLDHYCIYVDDLPINKGIPSQQNNFTLTLTEGRHTITVKAVDKAGNAAEDTIETIIDTTPPTVSIYSPENGATLNTTTIIIEFSGSDNIGIDHYEIYVDDFIANINIPPERNNYTLTLAEGTHIITVSVVDKAGNTAKSTVEIEIITTITIATRTSNVLPYLVVGIIIAVMLTTIAIIPRRLHGKGGP
mgnify:CR=1 FL=1